MAAGIYAARCAVSGRSVPNRRLHAGISHDAAAVPDQMVFLTDTFYLDQETLGAGQAVASSKTGELLMQMDAKRL